MGAMTIGQVSNWQNTIGLIVKGYPVLLFVLVASISREGFELLVKIIGIMTIGQTSYLQKTFSRNIERDILLFLDCFIK